MNRDFKMANNIISFLRKKDYTLIKELGQGSCGQTVLLYDDVIGENFVCKKYLPCDESLRKQLYDHFTKEIKHLHKIFHNNIVRIFNYYLYPEHFSGYILMEYIDGSDIEDYSTSNPEQINELFIQLIDAFKYLESNNILHRDIRPQNILVSVDGTLKLIDLGFSKKISTQSDFDKSISLNWWCELPEEFLSDTYDFRTEVYFVGKLYERIISEIGIEHFKYTDLLKSMCEKSPSKRIRSFLDISNKMLTNIFFEIEFTTVETHIYRTFSDKLHEKISKIDTSAKYEDDIDKIQAKLEDAYRRCMLETDIPDTATITRCFINGPYRYFRNGFPVVLVKNFIDLLKSSPPEKKKIIYLNIFSKLDSIKRYTDTSMDDVPF